MNANERRYLHAEPAVGANHRLRVHCGERARDWILEKVYENSLAHELRKYGLQVEQQRGVAVLYDGVVVGDYTVDLLVEESLIIELKTVRVLGDVHRAQCMNYLRAANLHLCLLLNFNRPRVQVERIVWRLPEDR